MLIFYIISSVCLSTYTVNADYGYQQTYWNPSPPLPVNNGWDNNYWGNFRPLWTQPTPYYPQQNNGLNSEYNNYNNENYGNVSNFQPLWSPPIQYYPPQNNDLNYNSNNNRFNNYNNGNYGNSNKILKSPDIVIEDDGIVFNGKKILIDSDGKQGISVNYNDIDGYTVNGKKIPVDSLGIPLIGTDVVGSEITSGNVQPLPPQNNGLNNSNNGYNRFNNYNNGYYGYGTDMYPQSYWNPLPSTPANGWTNWPYQGASVEVQNGVLMVNGKTIPGFVVSQGAVIKYGGGILTINGKRYTEFDGITGKGTINIGPNTITNSDYNSNYDYYSDYDYDEDIPTNQNSTPGRVLQMGNINVGSDGIKIGGPNGIEMSNDGIKIGGQNGLQIMNPNWWSWF